MVLLWDLKCLLCLALGFTYGMAELSIQYQIHLMQAVTRSRYGNYSWNNVTTDPTRSGKSDTARKVLMVLGAAAIFGIVMAAVYSCVMFVQKQMRENTADTMTFRRTDSGPNLRNQASRGQHAPVGRVERLGPGTEVRANRVQGASGIRNEGFQPDFPISVVGDSFQLDSPPNYHSVVRTQQSGKTKEVILVVRSNSCEAETDSIPEDELPPPYSSVVQEKYP